MATVTIQLSDLENNVLDIQIDSNPPFSGAIYTPAQIVAMETLRNLKKLSEQINSREAHANQMDLLRHTLGQ